VAPATTIICTFALIKVDISIFFAFFNSGIENQGAKKTLISQNTVL